MFDQSRAAAWRADRRGGSDDEDEVLAGTDLGDMAGGDLRVADLGDSSDLRVAVAELGDSGDLGDLRVADLGDLGDSRDLGDLRVAEADLRDLRVAEADSGVDAKTLSESNSGDFGALKAAASKVNKVTSSKLKFVIDVKDTLASPSLVTAGIRGLEKAGVG